MRIPARLIPSPSKLEVPAIGRPSRPALGSSGQQPDNASQILPRRLIQRRIGANQIADHIPRRNVERSFWRWPHRQRDRALRTETDPLRARFLSRPYPYRLREHINRNRFVSCFELSITAKTIEIFQGPFPEIVEWQPTKYWLPCQNTASMQKDSRCRASVAGCLTLSQIFSRPPQKVPQHRNLRRDAGVQRRIHVRRKLRRMI